MRPLNQLSASARAFGEGNLQTRVSFQRNDELGEVGQAFDEMAERIQRLLLAEKELMANVSHELRTPLARIRVALDVAGEGNADVAKASLAEIAVDLSELETIINDILTVQRMEMSEGQTAEAGFILHTEKISPEILCQQAEEKFRITLAKRIVEAHRGAITITSEQGAGTKATVTIPVAT